jgi:catechol-2,3-dioxygenase
VDDLNGNRIELSRDRPEEEWPRAVTELFTSRKALDVVVVRRRAKS